VTAVRHDHVVAALHVFDCYHDAVAISQVGAGTAGVIAIEPKSVYPTIVHVKLIIGEVGMCSGSGCWDNG